MRPAMICPRCDTRNADGAEQCSGCGDALARCGACGAVTDPRLRFCRACGARAAAFAATAPAAVGAAPGAPAPGAAAGPGGGPAGRAARAATRQGALGRITAMLRLRERDDGEQPRLGSLLLAGPRGQSREIALGGVRELVLGRDPPADVVLADPGVSRRHARIVHQAAGFYVVDLGSRNGTRVNGEAVRGRRTLEPGDEIEVGPFRLRARPPESGDTVALTPRRQVPGRALALAACVLLAAGAVAAGVALAVSRGSSRPPVTAAQPPAGTPTSESQQAADAVRRVRPSVVRIRTRTASGTGVGTGIVIDDRLIITNAHVVAGDPSPTLTLADGRDVSGRVLGADDRVDLAVVRVDVSGLTPAAWGDTAALQPGDRLIAIGYALGATAFSNGEPTVTSGIFSGMRDYRGQSYVQTDTPVNPGNSGGPLINIKGEVIGINVLVIGRTVELQAQGLNLAIPAGVARALIPDLRDAAPRRDIASPAAP